MEKPNSMGCRTVKPEQLIDFEKHLTNGEKSAATIQKYLHDVGMFIAFVRDTPVTKEIMIAYKSHLMEQGYAPASINSMLASLNSFCDYMDWPDCKVKTVRMQKKVYCPEEQELTKEEYLRLLSAARSRPRLYLLLQTICSTGIRVSELKHFTVEAVRRGEITVQCKSKIRTILVPGKLKSRLLNYARQSGISSGTIFITQTGKPLDRSNIWKQMKSLCSRADVNPQKVFPHNLRKLFARVFYAIEKDIAKLADILGHSSIETTRIYIMTTGIEHRKQMERLKLII